MKKIMYVIALAFCALNFSIYVTGMAIAQQGAAPPTPEEASSSTFRDVYPVVRLKSRVPPELPTFFPYTDKNNPAHAIIESADQSGYQIMLAWVLPCAGGHNCLYGSVRGSAVPFTIAEGKPRPVKLFRRIQGSFIESVCEINCTQSHVGWSEHGFYYSVGVKAGKKQDLIKMANSAISAGQ